MRPPADLLVRPPQPMLEGHRQSDLLRLVVALREWGDQGWSNVEAIQTFYAGMER